MKHKTIQGRNDSWLYVGFHIKESKIQNTAFFALRIIMIRWEYSGVLKNQTIVKVHFIDVIKQGKYMHANHLIEQKDNDIQLNNCYYRYILVYIILCNYMPLYELQKEEGLTR
jgi:hypothetical protein